MMSPQAAAGAAKGAGFRTLDGIDLRGKRVLLRVDLNVPMADGAVLDKTRITRMLPTLREIVDHGGRAILLSHFGRPKNGPDKANSLEPLAIAIERELGRTVAFADDCVGPQAEAAVAAMQDGDILLLENTRFQSGETKNDPAFVAAMAKLGDLYVNDAFSAAHRAHASTEGLAHKLPAVAGRAMQAELEHLELALSNPARPVAAIVGGAKVSSKLDLLGNLMKKVDILIIGGGMANTFLFAQGKSVGTSLCEKEMAETARTIMADAAAANCEIVLPVDAVVAAKFAAGAEAARRTRGRHSRRPDDPGCRSTVHRPRGGGAPNGQDAGVERPLRRVRDPALRPGHGAHRPGGGGPDESRQAGHRGRRGRHGLRAQRRGRERRLHLPVHGGRCVP